MTFVRTTFHERDDTVNTRPFPFLRTLASTALLALMSIATGAVAQSRPLRLAWVHGNAAAQSEQRVKAGFEQWSRQSGKQWKVSYLDSKGSGEQTAANLQDAVSRNVDAIVITMADMRASRAALDSAVARQVPVFTVDSGWVPGVTVDVTANNWGMSADVSLHLLNLLDGEGGIIFLRMAEHHGTRKRGDTMAAMLKEFPKVKVLAEHNIDYKAYYEDTTRVMENYAARFGHQIKGVWAPWDEPAQAAVAVLKAKGIQAWVTGIDGHPGAIQQVRDPHSRFAATVSQPFEGMGAKTGEWIEQIVGLKQPAGRLFQTHTVYLPAPLVTKSSR